MGPNFQSGATRIGRRRLPRRYAAILDDHDVLLGALDELHQYALAAPEGVPREKHAIIFRVVDTSEVNRFNFKLQELLGAANLMDSAAIYSVRVGHWHVVDSEHVAHAYMRHSDAEREAKHGHLPITVFDLKRIPEVVLPRCIQELSVSKGTPRIVYRRRYGDGELSVVEEIRSRELAVKTVYKQK
jgi:hypothetical protein